MNILELLNEVNKGSVVLPDFQRSFVWGPEDIRELLVSILGGYFIGSILLLEKLKEESPFKLRLVEGVEMVNPTNIQKSVIIVLDGQQRITALYYALYNPPINLKNRNSPYKFYLNIDKALAGDHDSAVLAISVRDRNRLAEISSNERIIEFSLLKDIGKLAIKFQGDPKFSRIIELANNFTNYSIHTVHLKDADTEKIVETFERINRTGKPLSIFDLLTAKLYKYDIKLRDIWDETLKEYKFAKAIKKNPEFIVKVMALNRGMETKRKNILEISHNNFKVDWYKACDYMEKAFNKITDIKNGYGVIDFKKWMPYSTMLIPLSSMMGYLEDNKLDSKSNYEKIDCWYWASIFSNRYDQAADTTTLIDFNSIKRWINEGKVPEFIKRFKPDEIDLEVSQSSSAIYRGVICLIVLKGALDFKNGQPPQFNEKKIQDDHIFPKSKYKYNGIANRTLLLKNIEKGNKDPSEYFRTLLREHGEEGLCRILQTHIIPYEALNYLLSNDLYNFIETRKKAIIDEVRSRINY